MKSAQLVGSSEARIGDFFQSVRFFRLKRRLFHLRFSTLLLPVLREVKSAPHSKQSIVRGSSCDVCSTRSLSGTSCAFLRWAARTFFLEYDELQFSIGQ